MKDGLDILQVWKTGIFFVCVNMNHIFFQSKDYFIDLKMGMYLSKYFVWPWIILYYRILNPFVPHIVLESSTFLVLNTSSNNKVIGGLIKYLQIIYNNIFVICYFIIKIK